MRFAPQDKLALHPQLADHIAGKRIYPIGLEISPSGTCTASCPSCWFAEGALGGFRKVFLNTKRMVSPTECLLWEARELGIKAITWTGGGDPSLHPDIELLVGATSYLGLEQGMFTNALCMPRFDPERLQWIRVTMTDRPYKIDCIKALRPCKTLGFAFNYKGPEDDDYLRETLNVADKVKADYVQLRPALKFHGECVDITPPKIDHPLLQVTGYKFEEAKYKHPYKKCEGFKFVPFLWETGDVDVCAYHRLDKGFNLGNIYKSSLKEILDNAPQSVDVVDNCQVACKLNEINLSIDRMRGLEDVHFP
jgi:MoaA/NifB/PqqE/SkfB family radical SAM enzyme